MWLTLMFLDVELERGLLLLLVELDLLELFGLLRGELLEEDKALVVVLVERGLPVELLRKVLHVKQLDLLAVKLLNELLEHRTKGVELVGQVQAEQIVKF